MEAVAHRRHRPPTCRHRTHRHPTASVAAGVVAAGGIRAVVAVLIAERIQDGRLRLGVDLRIGEHLLDLGELLIQKLAERRHRCRITHLRANLLLLVLNLGQNGRHPVAGALIGREDLLEHLGELLVGQLCGFNAAVVLVTCAGCPGIKATPTTRRRRWRRGGRHSRIRRHPSNGARVGRRLGKMLGFVVAKQPAHPGDDRHDILHRVDHHVVRNVWKPNRHQQRPFHVTKLVEGATPSPRTLVSQLTVMRRSTANGFGDTPRANSTSPNSPPRYGMRNTARHRHAATFRHRPASTTPAELWQVRRAARCRPH